MQDFQTILMLLGVHSKCLVQHLEWILSTFYPTHKLLTVQYLITLSVEHFYDFFLPLLSNSLTTSLSREF